MSGGHFDYGCFAISQFAESLEQDIESNNIKDDYGYAHDFNDKTIALLTACQQKIEVAGKLAREVEWLYSDDHGEETFAEIVGEILGGVK